jgi:GMP synthase PP-ATPase subunit
MVLRLNEPEQVREIFGDKYGLKIISVNARSKVSKGAKGCLGP